MKIHVVVSAVAIVTLLSCNSSKSEAEKTADKIQQTIQSTKPGTDPVAKTGSWLKATIDGKEWEATHMLTDNDPNSSYRQVSGEGGDVTISFQLWKPEAGRVRKLGDDMAIDFWTGDDILGGRVGEIVVTRADNQWVEGTFHFSATKSDGGKTYEVTKGSFRIQGR